MTISLSTPQGRCPLCGLSLYPDSPGVCLHHDALYGPIWHIGNKIWCDFIHRRIVLPYEPEPPEPTPTETEDDGQSSADYYE